MLMKHNLYKKVFLFLVLSFISLSLVTSKSLYHEPNLIKVNGKVEIKVGNQMPQISNYKFARKPSNNSELKIVAVPGQVKLVDNNISMPIDNIPPGGIITETNALGKFTITLKPGKYTFFILKDKEAYRNNFDERGFFTQTEIKKDTNDLILTYDKFAFF